MANINRHGVSFAQHLGTCLPRPTIFCNNHEKLDTFQGYKHAFKNLTKIANLFKKK